MLDHAAVARRSLPSRAVRPERLTEIRVPVPDRPGVLAEITTLAGDLGVNISDLEIAHSAEGERGVLVLVVDADGSGPSPGRPRSGRGYRSTARTWMTGPSSRSAAAGPCGGTWPFPGTSPSPTGPCCSAALAEGTSELRGLSDGDDVVRSAAAVSRPRGPDRGHVDHRRSPCPRPTGRTARHRQFGTTIRLLAGLVAGLDFAVVLTGDASLSSRPMDRVAVPLRLMGATVGGRGERCLPPLTIRAGPWTGIDYTPPWPAPR